MWKYCWWDSWWCTSRTEDLPHYRLMVSSLPSVSSLPLYFCLHAFFLVQNNFAHLFPKGGGATPKYVNSFLKNEGEQAPFFMVLYGLWSYNWISQKDIVWVYLLKWKKFVKLLSAHPSQHCISEIWCKNLPAPTSLIIVNFSKCNLDELLPSFDFIREDMQQT